MAPRDTDRAAPSPDTASAIELVTAYSNLLIFSCSGENEEIFWDALDRPPTHPCLILDEKHPAFAQALACTKLEDLLDFLTRACLLGRQGKEHPTAFTHASSGAAHALALKAMSLNVANVFKGVTKSHDDRIASDSPPEVDPSLMVALVPVFDSHQRKCVDLMTISDPREGGCDDGTADPLAAVISVAGSCAGYPHNNKEYRDALRQALAPSDLLLMEMKLLLGNDLRQYSRAVRRMISRLFERYIDDPDDDGGDLN